MALNRFKVSELRALEAKQLMAHPQEMLAHDIER